MASNKPDRNRLLGPASHDLVVEQARARTDEAAGGRPYEPDTSLPPSVGPGLSDQQTLALANAGVWLGQVTASDGLGGLSVTDAAGTSRPVKDWASGKVPVGAEVACVLEQGSDTVSAAVGVMPVTAYPAGENFPQELFRCQRVHGFQDPQVWGRVVEDTGNVLGFGAGALVCANGFVWQPPTGPVDSGGSKVTVIDPATGAALHTFPEVPRLDAADDEGVLAVHVWDGRLFAMSRSNGSFYSHRLHVWTASGWAVLGSGQRVFFLSDKIVVFRGSNAAGESSWLLFLAAGATSLVADTDPDPVTADVRVTTYWVTVGEGRIWTKSLSENYVTNYEVNSTKLLVSGSGWTNGANDSDNQGGTRWSSSGFAWVLRQNADKTWSLHRRDDTMALTLWTSDAFKDALWPVPQVVEVYTHPDGSWYASGFVTGENVGAHPWARIPVIWKWSATHTSFLLHWIGYEYASEGSIPANLRVKAGDHTVLCFTVSLMWTDANGNPQYHHTYTYYPA